MPGAPGVFFHKDIAETIPKIPSAVRMSISISQRQNGQMWNEEKKCDMLKKKLDKKK